MIKIKIVLFLMLLSLGHAGFAQIPSVDLELKNASVSTQGNVNGSGPVKVL
jgi:hypothetical protein